MGSRSSSIRLTVVAQAIAIGVTGIGMLVVARVWGSDLQGHASTAVAVGLLAGAIGGVGSMDLVLRAAGDHSLECEHRVVWLSAIPLIALTSWAMWWIASGNVFDSAVMPAVVYGIVFHVTGTTSLWFLTTGRQLLYETVRIALPTCLTAAALIGWWAALASPIGLWLTIVGALGAVTVMTHRRTWLGAVARPSAATIRFGVTAAIGSATFLSVVRFDILLVNRWADRAAAGQYAVAIALSEVPQQLSRAASPLLAGRAATAGGATPVSLLVAATTGLAALTVAASVFVERLLPSDYSSVSEATVFLCVAAPALAFVRMRWAVGILSADRVRLLFIMLTGLTFMIAADFVVVPRHGIVGAAVISAVAYLGVGAATLSLVRAEDERTR